MDHSSGVRRCGPQRASGKGWAGAPRKSHTVEAENQLAEWRGEYGIIVQTGHARQGSAVFTDAHRGVLPRRHVSSMAGDAFGDTRRETASAWCSEGTTAPSVARHAFEGSDIRALLVGFKISEEYGPFFAVRNRGKPSSLGAVCQRSWVLGRVLVPMP